MDIQSGNSIKSNLADVKNKTLENKISGTEPHESASTDSIKVSQSFDKATGLLQTIISEQLSDKVIKKMPPDEYLQLLSLVDKMMTGSIDNKV